MAQRLCIYGAGLFNSGSSTQDQHQLQEMQASRFDTVLLWSLHVQPNGDFHYNNTPMVVNGAITPQVNPLMPSLIARWKLVNPGKTLLFSIGSGGVPDFANIMNLLSTPAGKQILENNFRALTTWIPELSGFDMDMEEGLYPAVTELTLFLHQRYPGAIITYCPYTDVQAWLGCLADVYSRNNQQQVVRWWNLQCYNNMNTPSQWIDAIINFSRPTGITRSAAQSYIIPGYPVYSVNGGSCPNGIRGIFCGLNVDGGFLWNTGDLFNNENSNACGPGVPMTPVAYSQAMYEGLNHFNC